jgi:hypothetical protein
MLSKISKDPVANFLIGVGGIIVGIVFAVGFYFLVEKKEAQPRYAVSEPETLAEATADAPGLKLLWEEEEIENVHTIDVVIWNAGRQFLDKNAISATDPIRITYPPGVKILYMKFTRTSRDNLKFTATDLAAAGTSAIQVGIVGDEALERKDGGLLRVLFSGPSTEEFVVTGRIKGSREGFIEVDWDRISLSPVWVAFLVGFVIFAMVMGVVGILSNRIGRHIRMLQRFRRIESFRGTLLEFFSLLGLLLGLVWLFSALIRMDIGHYVERLIFFSSFRLPWLP